MEQIKSFGLIICILMLLMAYLKQVIPRGKTTYLMKAIISVFILLSILQGVMDFDFSRLRETLSGDYTHNKEVWSNAAELVADGLKREFQAFLNDQTVDALVVDVIVDGNEERFEIEKVIVGGKDPDTAKNLLAGRYQIGLSSIEVKNE